MKLSPDARVVPACLGFGTGYGAVCGALFAALMAVVISFSGDPGLEQFIVVPLLGAILGGLGGGAGGLLGSALRGCAGWTVAGLVGGFCSLALPAVLISLLGGQAPLGVVLASALIPAAIGGGVGHAVGRGLQRGQSTLPGVDRLGMILREGRPNALPPGDPALPTEVTPAGSPDGRGDEVALAELGA